MRPLLIIILLCFSCLSFGQDSLQIDTVLKPVTSASQDKSLIDLDSSTLKTFPSKKTKQRKKVQKSKIKEDIVFSQEDNTENIDNSRNDSILIFAGILIVAVIIIIFFSRSNFSSADKNNNGSSKEDEFTSDYLSRIFLSRREYYRNIYLKSEAW